MNKTSPTSITLGKKNLEMLDKISETLGTPSRSETIRYLIVDAYEKKNGPVSV